MRKVIRKIQARLFAGILAAGICISGIPAGQIVSAAETRASVREITGFAELPEEEAIIRTGGKVPLDLLTARMPSALEAYLDGSESPVRIPVAWKCVGDYEHTSYFFYEFDPVWDKSQYRLSRSAEESIPYIGVFLDRASGSTIFKMASLTDNEKTVYEFMKNEMGLNTAAACGVLANIQAESSFRPTAEVLDVNDKISYGICQWNGVRFDALREYCSQYGYDYQTLEGQLNYLRYELEHTEASAFSKVKHVQNTADGAYEAGYNWARYFERCASIYHESRGKSARDAYWPKYSSDSEKEQSNKKKYSITYYLNDGTNNSANPKSYTPGTATITLKNPSRAGYAFQGWYKDSGMSSKITSIPKGSHGNLKLYAKWKANRYTVRFRGNKSTSGNVAAMKCEYDSSYDLPANKFKKKGYKFAGWNTKANGKGDSYKNKEEIENLSQKEGDVITLYAQWRRQTYDIQYETKGGRLSGDARDSYNVDTRTFRLEEPVRTGYTFAGWYKEKNFKTKVTQIRKGSTGNITLYAKWSANKYKIRYRGNGEDSGSMNTVTVPYGKTYKLAGNSFKRREHVFTGWNTKADGSGKTYADRASVKNLASKNNKTVTLYAQWKKKSYRIRYQLNGGMMLEENPDVYYADTKTFSLKLPEREGYTFQGWYTEPGFKNKIAKIKKGTKKNYKLYAKWKANTYTVRYDGNGASTGKMGKSVCRYGESYTLSPNRFSKDGFRFIGWNSSADGTGTFYGDSVQAENLSAENGAVVTLYAQWEKIE